MLALFFLSIGSKTLRLGFNLPREVILTLGFSTFFIALAGVAWPLRIAAGIARYLPWPRILPLKELLQSVPANGNAGEVSLRREFEDNREEANLMAVLQNVIWLKQVLFKEDKALLEKWIKGRRRRRIRKCQPKQQRSDPHRGMQHEPSDRCSTSAPAANQRRGLQSDSERAERQREPADPPQGAEQ